MKYLVILFIALFAGSNANALCFDLPIFGNGTAVGTCGEGLEKIPVTTYFIIWGLINVALGQALLSSRVHLGFKYILFILGVPLSPFVVVFTLTGVFAAQYFRKIRIPGIKLSKDDNVSSTSKPEMDTHSASSVEAKTIRIKDVSIGEYTFNRIEQSLVKDNQANVLEPKCMDVLSYLVEQQPRIVSLEELHNNVWENQIVTDTAVRRTISKLRQAFADDDTKNPKYIKSIMKRGYQLIAEVKTQAVE